MTGVRSFSFSLEEAIAKITREDSHQSLARHASVPDHAHDAPKQLRRAGSVAELPRVPTLAELLA